MCQELPVSQHRQCPTDNPYAGFVEWPAGVCGKAVHVSRRRAALTCIVYVCSKEVVKYVTEPRWAVAPLSNKKFSFEKLVFARLTKINEMERKLGQYAKSKNDIR